jgi:hypothetical protein
MPTVLRVGPYSFVFFSSDRTEPPHIHAKREKFVAKFWLNPVSVANNHGFAENEMSQIGRLVVKYEEMLLEAWHDYFGT